MKEEMKNSGEEEVLILPGLEKNDAGEIVYENSYDGFFRWQSDKGRREMVLDFDEYSKIVHLKDEMLPASKAYGALGHALHDIRKSIFDEIKFFLDSGAGQKRSSKRLREVWADMLRSRGYPTPSELRTQWKEPGSQAQNQAEGKKPDQPHTQGEGEAEEGKGATT